MKFNFRKIASVLSSAVMVSSTVALAAAATYPAPFIKSGQPNVAIVYGQNAPLDLAAVINVNNDLNSRLAGTTSGSSGGSTGSSTVIGGDYVKLHTENDEFNLGESMSSFYSSLDSDNLATVLADGTYENDDNDEFDYTQEISLGKIPLTHFQDSDYNDDKPVIGFNMPDGTFVLNYTLDFNDAADGGNAAFDSLEDTNIKMLGRDYYIVRATPGAGSTGMKIELLDAANSVTLTKDEAQTIQVGDKSYEVTLTYSHSTNGVAFHVTGDGIDFTTDKMSTGDVKKISNDVYLAVKENLAGEGDQDVDQAVISLGTGKITIQQGEEVQVNNEDISDIDKYNDAVVTANIVNSTEHLDSITLSWTVGDDTFLSAGSDALILPGFGTIKLAMGAWNTPKKEMTTLENDGSEKLRVKTSVADGSVQFPLVC